MANLLDAINQNSQQAAAQPQGVTDETSKLGTLLRARTGKSLSGALGASNLGEQSAVSQTNQQMQGQVAPQAAIQATAQNQQAAGQQQQFNAQSQQIGQARKFDDIRTQLQVDSTLKDLERNKGQVDLQKDKAQLDQVAQTLRLQNQQYISNLQREGQRARLDNSNDFTEAYTDAVFDNSKEILEKNLGNKSIVNANDRDFQKALAQMGADDAYSMFRAQQKATQDQAMWAGIGGLAQAGIGAYGSYSDAQAKNAPPTATSSTSATGYGGGDASNLDTDRLS